MRYFKRDESCPSECNHRVYNCYEKGNGKLCKTEKKVCEMDAEMLKRNDWKEEHE